MAGEHKDGSYSAVTAVAGSFAALALERRPRSRMSAPNADSVCEVGGGNDGTLRVCCSSHNAVMCGRHYARTHFVEVGPEWDAPPCN